MATASFRCVLESVPRIHFYEGGPRCPEDIPLPSILRALMEYFGETDFGCNKCRTSVPGCRIPCSYAFFVGVTGAAAFLSWKEGWADDNAALHNIAEALDAAEQRGFNAAGYSCEYFKKKGCDQESGFREKIVASIQRGRPVLAYGVVGPPEPCLITGYDESGDVLLGWSFFQHMPEFVGDTMFEDSGYFRKRHWFETTHALCMIGEKHAAPPLGQTCRDALAWMLQVARTTKLTSGRANGIAAYAAWADHLLLDDDFPNDERALRQRHDVHNNVVGMVAEARWYGAQFLIHVSNPEVLHYRAAEHVLHAAACYAAEHRLMWQLWDLAGGNGNPEAWRRFAEPAIRRRMRPLILEAQKHEKDAIHQIDLALETLNVS